MLAALFTSLFVQGLLLGLAALALLAAAPGLQKRYGPQWLCRLWVVLAVLLLVPVHFLLPKAPALVSVRTEPLYSVNAAPAQGTTEEPPAGTTYAVTNEASGVTRHYIASYQTEQAGPAGLQRAASLDVLSALWAFGMLAAAIWQLGGYAVWRLRVRRTAQQPAQSWRNALPQGQSPRMLATPLVHSPMVAGILRPVLLVPAGEAPHGAAYMLAHELTHIARQDVAQKLLFTLACLVHWYNPAAWLLAVRAGRDIEAACDAETLRGRSAAYRDAYADALLTAVRLNRGPALTSGFALNKRQFRQRLAALWDTAPKHRGRLLLAVLALTVCCAGGLVACRTADTPQDEPAAEAPAPTAAPTATPAASTTRPMPTREEMDAFNRESSYFWDEYLPSLRGYIFNNGMANEVDIKDDGQDGLREVLAQKRKDGTTWQEYLEGGNGILVKQFFDAELQPEYAYLGPQYGEGRFFVYVAAPLDESESCEVISGWQQNDASKAPQFAILDDARELKLTNKQYRMLLHQCDALALAGIRNFAGPADWTQDELESYLYYRNGYFYNEADALMILNLDFSDTKDWNALPPYLTYDEMTALDWSAPRTSAMPGYSTPVSMASDGAGGWRFTRDGDTITAEWPGAQRYTFAVHNDEKDWFSRTVCTGGESLQ